MESGDVGEVVELDAEGHPVGEDNRIRVGPHRRK
jgi:hypothetical protein